MAFDDNNNSDGDDDDDGDTIECAGALAIFTPPFSIYFHSDAWT